MSFFAPSMTLLMLVMLTACVTQQQAVIGVYPANYSTNTAAVQRALPIAPAPESTLPDSLREIRRRQDALYRSEGLLIGYTDEGNRSLSSLGSVPAELEGRRFRDAQAVAAMIDELYDYLGFCGSESLVLQHSAPNMAPVDRRVRFLELINGIPTESTFTVELDDAGGVYRFIGSVLLDRGHASRPALSEQQALVAASRYAIEQEGRPVDSADGNSKSSLLYRTLRDPQGLLPWWYVEVGGVGSYYVGPEGEVENAVTITR